MSLDGNINGKVYGGRCTLKECNKKGIVFSWVGLSFYNAFIMFQFNIDANHANR